MEKKRKSDIFLCQCAVRIKGEGLIPRTYDWGGGRGRGDFPPLNFFLHYSFLPENFSNTWWSFIFLYAEWTMHKRTNCFLWYKTLSLNIARRTSCCLIKGPNLINGWKRINQFPRENSWDQRENSSGPKRKWISFKEKIALV
jgi:hypothetical protein